jgi:hypothetical protein
MMRIWKTLLSNKILTMYRVFHVHYLVSSPEDDMGSITLETEA